GGTGIGGGTMVVNALGDDDATVQKAAETAIAGLPHERAVPLLTAALSSGGSQVRVACARLLSKRADKSAVDPLIALMTAPDESDEVRAAAREALKAHHDYIDLDARKAAAADTDADNHDARIAALRVLAAVGDASAPALVTTALKDPNASIRIAAARAAADIGGDAGKKLIEGAKARESDPRTQKQLDLLLQSVR
ncbi:MAG TPA: HEAT repeat domain-containing protein, partial [Myxococcota bacterium]